MRKKIFGANWKMNHTKTDAITYFKELSKLLENFPHLLTENEVVFFPPMQLLVYLQDVYGTRFNIGSQNFHYKAQGAYTGEVSLDMLLLDDISYALVGHSERREYFKETDNTINEKVCAAIIHKIKTILCVGEPLNIREKGQEKEYIKNQLTLALKSVSPKAPNITNYLALAYEPIWAIGTGKTATVNQIEEMHIFIRNTLEELGFESEKIQIMYGGSVNKDTAKEILELNNVDGVLVGSASLKPLEFFNIINY